MGINKKTNKQKIEFNYNNNEKGIRIRKCFTINKDIKELHKIILKL